MTSVIIGAALVASSLLMFVLAITDEPFTPDKSELMRLVVELPEGSDAAVAAYRLATFTEMTDAERAAALAAIEPYLR